MNKFKLILGIGLSLSVLLAADHSWSYSGKHGPEHWGDDFITCKVGNTQSPINIIKSQVSEGGKKVEIDYKNANATIENNGHTVQINYPKGNYATIGDDKYELIQFHFHTPGENAIDGKVAPLEAHFVGKDSKGKYAVIAVLFEEGKINGTLQQVIHTMPTKVNVTHHVHNVKINGLLPKDDDAYQFSGSLTTPPCTQDIEWVVLKEPVSAARSQIKALSKVMGHNARPLQKLNNREIKAN
ncbi:carbonic anhydrase family protein [Helicobacter sp. 11S02629-2]|uniref:carbonic anhydrase n=1 Tax=Helicobacter sp. 11S02629-2 TaxID=1476195 RepID=UPI000BA78BD4|nr:carbonic anhydrase family protein [Helicobacter sp. 11S02629-2]PAF44955.1 hypothetical protein BKH40_04515 [Helicobacter sp. 11S02629-2]